MFFKNFSLITLSVLLVGCTSIPDKVTPINQFELNRYLGDWYEIARLDHSFERGLENVTANYSMRDDGGVTVINKGFSAKDGEWSEAKGKAYFVKSEQEGYLKVSFFGPFYGSYIIFGLDKENYNYAFISGPNLSYLWLLARTPTVDQKVIDEFIRESSKIGFNIDNLIFVNQN
jgi:apolipoprotein D and lipocalin family protein